MQKEHALIGSNIKKAREQLNLTQSQLAEIIGFTSHQIISDIERGIRDVKAHELATFANVLCISMNELIHCSAKKIEQPLVCWRQEPGEDRNLIEAKLIHKTKQYSMLQELGGLKPDKDFYEENVDFDVDFDEISTIGERAKDRLGLGDIPALGLFDTLEERYGVQIWCLPGEELGDGSAASIKHNFGIAVFINNDEPIQRQYFSCAHELFHLITWGSFKGIYFEENGVCNDRVEKLANSFAASLLLPKNYFLSELKKVKAENKISYLDLFSLARKFQVVPDTLLWRMQNLGIIDSAKETIDSPRFNELRGIHYKSEYRSKKNLPERFVWLAFQAYCKSQISRGKLSELLNVSLIDLGEELEEFGVNEEADYQREICTL